MLERVCIVEKTSRVEHHVADLLYFKFLKNLIFRRNKRCLALYQKVISWERNEIGCKFSEVTIVFDAWEAKGGCSICHALRNQPINVFEARILNFLIVLTNSVECWVFDREDSTAVLDECI